MDELKRMEEKFDTHLGYIKQSFDRNEKDHEELSKIINEFIKSAEHRFAPRWVGEAMKWFIGIITGSVIIAVISLVIRN